MNAPIEDYYKKSQDQKNHSFSDVIHVDDNMSLTWDELKKTAPLFPRGWFELVKLSKEDRSNFLRDFWLKQLPYTPLTDNFIFCFFDKVEDVTVFLTKQNDSPYEVELVYSIYDDEGFFRGKPCSDNEIITNVNHVFGNMLPADFLSFCKIHNGFAKNFDTGILPIDKLQAYFDRLQSFILEQNKSISIKNKDVDPSSLIPFYQDFGLNSFQCFYLDWYPGNSLGNVYYSGSDNTISNYLTDNIGFHSFIDWLMFYLEEVIS